MRFTIFLTSLLYASSAVDASEAPRLRNDHHSSSSEHAEVASGRDNCIDNPRFVDSYGDRCSFYDDFPKRCDDRKNQDGQTPNSECCACGGGTRITPSPTRSPTRRPTPRSNSECTDYPNYADVDNLKCSYYDTNAEDCLEKYKNDDGVSPLEACCVCGGGTTENNPPAMKYVSNWFLRALAYPEKSYYLYIDRKEGVSMRSDKKVIVNIVAHNDKYALKAFCPNQSTCEDTYLTVQGDYGASHVATTSRLTSTEEFDIETETIFGSIAIKHVESGRYLTAREDQVIPEITLGINARFEPTEYRVDVLTE